MERLRGYSMAIEFSRKEMDEMEAVLSSFLESNKIQLTIPIDIFQLATEQLGFDIRGTEFKDKLEGILVVNEFQERIEGFDSNKVIAYNCFKDINAKKFIVAHELAHYIEEKQASKDAKLVVAARDHEDYYSDNIDEQRKDYIAAALLVPQSHLKKYYKKEDFINNTISYDDVAERYNVDRELAKRRVQEVF